MDHLSQRVNDGLAPSDRRCSLSLEEHRPYGQFALTEAFKIGEASFIAPFEYTALAWGVGLDWFVWKTVPAPVTLLGAFVVIASGVYLVRRERVHVEVEHP